MLKVEQVSHILEISSSMVYALIKRGELGCHKFGRCIRVSTVQLSTFLAATAEQQVQLPQAKQCHF